MHLKLLITDTEQKFLLRFMLLAFFVLLLNLAPVAIHAYNDSVERDQLNRRTEANYSYKLNAKDETGFTVSDCGRIFNSAELNRFISFILLPISFILSKKAKILSFLFSLGAIFLLFSNFILWHLSTLRLWHLIEPSYPITTFDLYFLNATVFDIFLFGLVSLIFVCQITIALRSIFAFYRRKTAFV